MENLKEDIIHTLVSEYTMEESYDKLFWRSLIESITFASFPSWGSLRWNLLRKNGSTCYQYKKEIKFTDDPGVHLHLYFQSSFFAEGLSSWFIFISTFFILNIKFPNGNIKVECNALFLPTTISSRINIKWLILTHQEFSQHCCGWGGAHL